MCDLDDPHTCIRLLTRDVSASIGEAYAGFVRDAVLQLRDVLAITDPHFVSKLVEDVQQRLHDEFVDTAWPACPRHSHHPLWFKDGWWWCETDNARMHELGSLPKR